MQVEIEKPQSKEYITRDTCRSCSEGLTEILPFGEVALPEWGEKDKIPTKVPLTLCVCESCTLVQLKETTKSDLLWNENYGYRSGINEAMVAHLTGIVEEVEKTVELTSQDFIVDIGANDGTLLAAYKRGTLVGYEPCSNLLPYFCETFMPKFLQETDGRKHSAIFFPYFFDKEPYQDNSNPPAKVVTAISMFYDLEDPNKFLDDVDAILDPNGLFIIQQNYLPTMLANNAFDNIVHEHLEYYSLHSMENLLDRHNMEVFDAEVNELNGGSIRTYIRKAGSSVTRVGGADRVRAIRGAEALADITNPNTYREFAARVQENGEILTMYLERAAREGKNIYVYGASTRGNTLLQGYGIDNRLVKGAAERNPDKYGKYTVGTNIPIVSEAEARADADVFLVLPWFFRDNFVAREAEFIANGGELVVPLPEVEIIKLDI